MTQLIDVADAAAKLRVVDVWKAGNPSGVVTVSSKYFRTGAKQYDRFVRHVTVGTDSLKWLAGTGTVACIPYLIPTDASDPSPDNWIVWKMIPDDARCFHVGDMEWHGENETFWHPRASGHEIENRGDFKTPIEFRQYVKSALLYAYDCARYKWLDRMVFDHSHIAIDHTASGGRRTDPQAGLFVESIWWNLIEQIRNDWPWNNPNDPPLWRGGSD